VLYRSGGIIKVGLAPFKLEGVSLRCCASAARADCSCGLGVGYLPAGLLCWCCFGRDRRTFWPYGDQSRRQPQLAAAPHGLITYSASLRMPAQRGTGYPPTSNDINLLNLPLRLCRGRDHGGGRAETDQLQAGCGLTCGRYWTR
jgi:hypothetical protein